MNKNYASDFDFLSQHKEIIELKDTSGKARIIVVKDYQGRVMTSTSGGIEGKSYGWINYDLIKSKKQLAQINAVGGEERFWLGPEGGQFSIFFKKGDSFDFANWNTPAEIDTKSFDLSASDDMTALFYKRICLKNYFGTTFIIDVNRAISILAKADVELILAINLSNNVQYVAYQSFNKITNVGDANWFKEKGLLSIWILGMLKPSEKTVMVIPFKNSKEAATQIRDNYFGKVPADRLIVRDGVLFFKADGQQRGKIGIPPLIVMPVFGSYDSDNNVLTIVQFDYNNETSYVNSLWKLQDDPFNGDVVNCYNDGPVEDGVQMGPFYELETSSATRELKVGEEVSHTHRTFHFEGDSNALDEIARKTLGVSLETIKEIF